jgi:hypothetical protein
MGNGDFSIKVKNYWAGRKTVSNQSFIFYLFSTSREKYILANELMIIQVNELFWQDI